MSQATDESTRSSKSHRPMYMAPSHSIPRLEKNDHREIESLVDMEVTAPVLKNPKRTIKSSLLSWGMFQSFVRVCRFSQRNDVRVFANALLYTALACLTAFYLIETAAYREETPVALKYVVMSSVVVSGLHTAAFLALGFLFLYPTQIWWTTVLDVGLCGLFIAFAVALNARWNDGILVDEVHWISVLGFFLVARLHTFSSFNMRLDSLVLGNEVNPETTRVIGVSISKIQQLIMASNLSDKCKQLLNCDLKSADIDGDGVLNRIEFFYFVYGSTRRNVLWNNPCSKARGSYALLQAQLEFDALVPEQDTPFLQNGKRKEKRIFSTVCVATKLLFSNQKCLGSLVVSTIFSGSITHPSFVILLGRQVNLGVELASMSPEDVHFDETLHKFTLGIIGLASLWTIDEVLWYISVYIGSRVLSNATARVQFGLARCALYGDMQFEDRYNVGQLSNVFSSSLAKTELVWRHFLYEFIRPVSSLLASIASLALFDVSYALFVVSIFPLIASFRFLESKATACSTNADASTARLLTRFQNTVNLQTPAKVCNSESFVLNRFRESLKTSRHDNFETLLWSAVVEGVFTTVGYGMNLGTTIVFLYELADGRLDVGSFFSVTGLIHRVIHPIEAIGMYLGEIARMAGSIHQIDTVLTEGKNHEDLAAVMGEKQRNLQSLSLDKELALESIRFSYGPGLPNVLEDISVSISSGSYVCFLAQSGDGKSTLLSLLTGSRTCDAGRVLMDGVDISTVPLSCLRHSLAVVFQETFVLDGTIFDNIAFGCVDRDSNEWYQLVVKAAIDAGIHDFIETLPDKYDTVIGKEAKISLSGGQLQRICGVARALARKPKLLVLDEATSSLDKISELGIIKTIERLRENGLTIVNFTHHPVTATNADSIIVFDKGRIAQQGTYNELYEQEGLFSSLVQAERRRSNEDEESDKL